MSMWVTLPGYDGLYFLPECGRRLVLASTQSSQWRVCRARERGGRVDGGADELLDAVEADVEAAVA